MNHMASFGILLRKDSKEKKKHHEVLVDDDLPPVHKAAAHGNIEQLVQDVLQDPTLVEKRSPEGLTPLGQAVLCQQLETVKRLIKMGVNIDAQDNVGRTCLSIAAYQGWHDGVMCLLRNGAKQNICDKSGRYPLHAATYHSDISTMALLLNGLTTKEINLPDHELMTAVHWAAFHDRPDHLMLLIQKGGDVLAKDIDGKLPLHWAAQNCSFQCVHRLTSLTEGLATVNEVDFSGKSPVHYAAAAGVANILKILARCDNVDMEMEDPDERTPLHWAAAMGHAEAVDTLLRLGVNPYPTDVDGCTPLDYALQTGHSECVKVMEVHLGTRSVKKYKQRYRARQGEPHQMMDSDLKYHYSPNDHVPARLHTEVESGSRAEDVPSIRVQPPTTTVTKTSVTDPPNLPRMFSASTDTDDVHRYEPPEASARSITDVSYREPLTARRPKEDNRHESVLAKLIGSSFMAGAQAPILANPHPRVGFNTSGPDQPEAEKTRQKEATGNDEADASRPEEDGQWASAAIYNPLERAIKTDRSDLKVMTSMNTPELNRVSVQSFRSIPPIVGSSQRKSSGKEMSNNVKDFKGVKLTPLPSITAKESIMESYPLAKSPRHQTSGKNSPAIGRLAPLRQPLRVTEQDISPPATNRTSQPPTDFMTENHAETRILTRRFKDTLNKFYDRAPAPGYVSGSTNREQVNKPGGKLSTLKGVPLHELNTASGFVKHSRILSTRQVQVVPQNTESTSEPEAEFQIPERGHKSTSTFCSVDVTPRRDKYIQDDNEHMALSPTPLAEAPASNGQGVRRGKQGNGSKQLKSVKHKPNAINKNLPLRAAQGNNNTEKLSHTLNKKSHKSADAESNSVTIQPILHTGKQHLARPKLEKKVQIAAPVAYH